jgi:major membrane immunogen (membrane-anchored lipoprotein)
MKKILFLFAAVALTFTACEKSTYVDGTYSVEFDEPDSHGWTAFLEFDITDDVISNVDFDYLNADGLAKSADTAYASRMYAYGASTDPSLFLPGLEANIAAATIVPEFEGVDVFTGATGSSEDAELLVEAALELALEGDPMSGTVTQPDPATAE